VKPGLALQYRPQSFDQIIGQRLLATALERMVQRDEIPTGLLFSGPSGTGKTTTARVLAQQLNGDEPGDVIEIDAASNGGVDAIRHLIETLRYGHTGRYRVVILDEAHSVSPEGFNALLKTLEEPPAGTVFVLVTTEPEKIPPTVLSRTIEFPFRRITPGEIYSRLSFIDSAEQMSTPDDILRDIAERAHGSARVGVMLLEQCSLVSPASLEEWLDLLGEHDGSPELLAACASGNHDLVFRVLDQQLAMTGNAGEIADQMVRLFRDLLVIRSGGAVTATGPALDARKALAQRMETERIFAAIRLLWDLKTRVRGVPEGSVHLEHVLILVSEVLTRGKVSASSAAAGPHSTTTVVRTPSLDAEVQPARRLTLADLQRR
jgi:DNA polymerase-3 subunit gamma/tau